MMILFTGYRNPAEGGLSLRVLGGELPQKELDELSGCCLELRPLNSNDSCCAIYPLSSGLYAVMVAMRVDGTNYDHRRHVIVHGLLAKQTDVQNLWLPLLFNSSLTKFFFSQPVNKAAPDVWELASLSGETNQLNTKLHQLRITDVVDFQCALRAFAAGQDAVCIHLEKSDANQTAAVIGAIAYPSDIPIPIISNGQYLRIRKYLMVTNSPADGYEDGKTISTDLNGFLRLGINSAAPAEPADVPDNVTVAMGLCDDFLHGNLTKYDLYAEIDDLIAGDPQISAAIKNRLRVNLEHLNFESQPIDRSLVLLLIAFKRTPDTDAAYTCGFEGIPYDLFMIKRFLRRKSGVTSHKYKKYLTALSNLILEINPT